MPSFYYKAKSFEGETKTGVLEAKDQKELARELRKDGFIVISFSTQDPSMKGRRDLLSLPFIDKFFGVSAQEKLIFLKNLRLMLRAGVGISRAMRTLAGQAKNSAFRKALLQVEDSLVKGSPLAEAFSKYPDIFPDFFVNMVKVGEESGTLDEALAVSAGQMEKEYRLRSKVKGAMMYPAVIIVVMLVIGVLMMLLVVPKLEQIFTELKIQLPLTTRIVIGISSFLRHFWFLIPFLAIGGVVLIRMVHRSKRGRIYIDSLLLKTPIVGALIRKVNVARTARTLGSLIQSGVPIVRSLEITAGTLGNVRFRDVLTSATDRVRRGETLHEHFIHFPNLYPAIVAHMVEVGEETGNLTEILKEVADFYEGEVDDTTKNLSTIIEPVLMVVIGVGVGFFAVSMIQPMYSMLSGI